MLRSHSLRIRGLGIGFAGLGNSEAVLLISIKNSLDSEAPTVEIKGRWKEKGKHANASAGKSNRAKERNALSPLKS